MHIKDNLIPKLMDEIAFSLKQIVNQKQIIILFFKSNERTILTGVGNDDLEKTDINSLSSINCLIILRIFKQVIEN